MLTRISKWYYASGEKNLTSLLSSALNPNIFNDIYVCIRRNPIRESEEETEIFDYFNVGVTDAEMAAYFYTKFGGNFFSQNYNIDMEYEDLKLRIKSVYKANLYKYKKFIELLGYKYNPLYNIDGVELYSNMESLGDTTNTRTPTGTIKNVTGTESDDSIGESTTTHYTNPYDDNDSNATNVNDKTTQSAITSEQSFDDYSESSALQHSPADNYVYNSSTGKWEKSGLFSVAAKDSAFGVSLGGAERYYAEKRIRQGNIGVTKTTELLRDQREIVKFNILDELFKDLEPAVVVGIY